MKGLYSASPPSVLDHIKSEEFNARIFIVAWIAFTFSF